jgi:ubiquinone biosynthesis protein COQ9
MPDLYHSERQAILTQALKHAPFEGWTPSMLEHAARDAGYQPFDTQRFLSGGIAELLAYFSSESDAQMAQDAGSLSLASMKVHHRIMAIISARLKRNLVHREAIRRAMAYYALPLNAPSGMQVLYKTLDEIWYLAGDTSTDFNFYTKRALLAPVFTSTVLFWLDDKSEDQKDTLAFLERRLKDVLKIQTFRKSVEATVSEFMKSPFGFLKRK